MRLERHLSPGRLAALSLSGSGLIFVCVLATVLVARFGTMPHKGRSAITLIVGGILIPGAIGILAISSATGRLRRGLIDQLWSGPSVASLRATLQSRMATLLAFLPSLLAFFWIVGDFVTHRLQDHHSALGAFSYFLLLPMITLSNLRGLLAPADPGKQTPWRRDLKPIVSEHWGEG